VKLFGIDIFISVFFNPGFKASATCRNPTGILSKKEIQAGLIQIVSPAGNLTGKIQTIMGNRACNICPKKDTPVHRLRSLTRVQTKTIYPL
jgi:hypothetical protein